MFYIVVAAARLDLGALRQTGWLFDMDTADDPWWRFYTFYGACFACLPVFDGMGLIG